MPAPRDYGGAVAIRGVVFYTCYLAALKNLRFTKTFPEYYRSLASFVGPAAQGKVPERSSLLDALLIIPDRFIAALGYLYSFRQNDEPKNNILVEQLGGSTIKRDSL